MPQCINEAVSNTFMSHSMHEDEDEDDDDDEDACVNARTNE